MPQAFSRLLSPLDIGALTVRNRVLVSAHVPGFAEDNKPGDAYIRYHRTYAENGVGLQITGGTPVHESGLLSTAKNTLWNLDESIVPGYRALSAAVHAEGGRILAQLAHSAGTVLINEPGWVSWSASVTRSETTGVISHAMTLAEIREVISAFGDAAERAARGNMDGVEILSAFGFLPQAFLSPLTNFRADSYGGSLQNRQRFLFELIEEVRSRIGPNKILGIRIPGDEFEPGGLTLDDMKSVCRALTQTRNVDYLNIIAHTNITHTGRGKHWAPTPSAPGTFVHLAAAIRSEVDVPVFTVGRITDPRHAEKILAAGQADMVGMTRAHICDPEIVSKIRRNTLAQIRPCVGANTCIANRYVGKTIRCMHNAGVAEPGSIIVKTTRPKKIAVIGGGPAGLECARISAERGHRVALFERDEKVGGQLALWAMAPSMRELGGIIRWRIDELNRLGVEMQCGREILEDEVDTLDADIVVVATGSDDHTGSITSDGSVQIVSPHAVLRGNGVADKHVLVFNEGRGQAGLVAAEVLLRQSCAVEIITSDIAVAADVDPTNRNAWYERLGEAGVEFTSGYVVESVARREVRLRNVFDRRARIRRDVDLIVSWYGCRSNNALANVKLSGNKQIHSIGDCQSPRNVEIAISEASVLANTL
ncbi:MAG: FAD-dependent oxidoreductase [Pseudomonadota bacterium]